MLLSEIFDTLNYGELAQLSLAGASETGVPEDSYPAIMSHLNLGMTELYKRFNLRERDLTLEIISPIVYYELKEKFAVSSTSSEPVRYILDTITDPFVDTILRINRVCSNDPENEIVLNATNHKGITIATHSYDTLKVTGPSEGKLYTVNYRAAPDKIVIGTQDPATIEVPIPESLLEPLIYYIAARAHTNVPGIDGNMSESQLYLQKFEMSIIKIKEENLIDTHHIVNTRPRDNRWP